MVVNNYLLYRGGLHIQKIGIVVTIIYNQFIFHALCEIAKIIDSNFTLLFLFLDPAYGLNYRKLVMQGRKNICFLTNMYCKIISQFENYNSSIGTAFSVRKVDLQISERRFNPTKLRHPFHFEHYMYFDLQAAIAKSYKGMSCNGNSPMNVKWYGKRGPWCYIISKWLNTIVWSWNVGFHNMNEMESIKTIKYVYLSINWSSVPGKGWTTKCIEDIFQGLILCFNKDFKEHT